MTNVEVNFTIAAGVSKVIKPNLISFPNLCYKDIIQQYSHLKGNQMNDNDEKMELLKHVITSASEYAQIKTKPIIRIGNRGEPVAEYTAFGWTIISVGREITQNHML